jgi:hypothetical protein
MNPTSHQRSPRRVRRLLGTGLVAGLMLTAAACGDDDDSADTTVPATTEPAPETTEAPETTVPETTVPETTAAPTPTTLPPTTTTAPVIPRMPLTGQVLENGLTVPDRPALVVKIDNNPRARPQSGLNEADIVFEEVVEAGTRFAVVFHSGDSNPVGPIRSGRTQDIDLLGGLNQPLFAWSGGNANVERAIADSDFIDLNPKRFGGLYRRQGNNPKPHNFYSTTDALFGATPPDATGRPTQLFSYFDPGVVPTGAPAGRAAFKMDSDSVEWEFDAATGGYVRTTNGRPHEDGLSGDRVNTANIVILETPYRPSFADANSPEAITIGGGRAWVVSGGVVREGSWLRATRTDGFALFDASGTLMPLQPGRTWVELADPVDGIPAFS